MQIDEEAVRGMSDSDLEEYLPKKGDRFALKDFLAQGQQKPKSSKTSLMDRLRDRLQKHRSNASSRDQEPESTVKIPKLSAQKETHRVHLGWYHFDEKKKSYLHLRAKSGGGKRTLMLNKSMNKESIINECLNLFFPNGKSQHGKLKDMETELTDFELKPLEDEETTLGDIIDRAKLQFVHFYLRTRLRPQTSNENTTSSIQLNASQQSTQPNETISKSSNKDENNPKPGKSSPTKPSSNVPQGLTDTTDKPVEITEGAKGDVLIKDGSGENLDPDPRDEDDNLSLPDPLLFPVWEDSLEEVAFTRNEPIQTVRTPKEFEIVVHRGQVLRELVAFFKVNPEVDFSSDVITATIVLPNGEREQAYDSGGVMRDLLTEFWDDFYERCTTGTNLKIPCLRHDMEAADWKAVGKIIALGWMVQKILPIRLAPNFLKSVLYGIAGDNLREEFLQFIPQSESRLLSSALENMENIDMDELLDVLSTHECKVRVTKENLGAVIDQIAHLEMVQEPAFIRECLFEVLITYELVMDVENEFQKITPTSKKLITSLQCEESESDSFKYLKKYIREIDSDSRMLRTLLRFLTASDLMLYDSEGKYFKIQVQIVDLEGIARRPVAHTCGRVLDLPRMYESYSVFKSEMNAVLNSNIWVMDFA